MIKLTEESKSDPNINQYECNICLEVASEPVITPCGHLYCWPCIYSWLASDQEFLSCPVCKNGISIKSLIPLYTKEEDQNNENGNTIVPEKKGRPVGVPNRPTPQRTTPSRNANMLLNSNNAFSSNDMSMNLQSGVLLAGFGFFPSLFNLVFQVENRIEDLDTDQRSPEVDHQPKLKMLYTIVIILAILMILMF